MPGDAWKRLQEAAFPRLLLMDGEQWFVAGGAAQAATASGRHRLDALQAMTAPKGGWWALVFSFDPDGPAHAWRPTEVAGPLAEAHGLTPAPTGDEAVALKLAMPTGDPVTTTREAWHAMVETALGHIASGGVEKVVLARTERCPAADPLALARRLAQREAGTQVFLLQVTAGEAWVGATPERLVEVDDREVRTHALAGSAWTGGAGVLGTPPSPAAAAGAATTATAPAPSSTAPAPGAAAPTSPPAAVPGRGDGGAAAQPANGAQEAQDKLAREHEAVVWHILDRLQEAGLTPEQLPRRTRRLRTVDHLETPIAAPRDQQHLLELAQALHPTPAICGWPVEGALELVRSLEPFERGWYGGGLGWFDAQGRGRVIVPLRCARVLPGATTLFAGAGIVAGSDEGAEWEETEAKLRPMREALP